MAILSVHARLRYRSNTAGSRAIASVQRIGDGDQIVVKQVGVLIQQVMTAEACPRSRCTALTLAPADTASDAVVVTQAMRREATDSNLGDSLVEDCAVVGVC